MRKSSLETGIDDTLDIIISSPMSLEPGEMVCSGPTPIAIHDEPYMLEHIVYKKIPRV
jgi:hypothetical protein